MGQPILAAAGFQPALFARDTPVSAAEDVPVGTVCRSCDRASVLARTSVSKLGESSLSWLLCLTATPIGAAPLLFLQLANFPLFYTREMMAKTKSLYGVHPSVAMVQKWVATLKEKTGRSLDEWLALVGKSGLKTEKERRAWLKTVHGLGMNTAWGIAEHAEPKGSEFASPEAYLAAAERYVESMFSGTKATLRPLYDELLRLSLGIGKDVKACPCQTMVPLYRHHVFAQIKPATQTRIDLGFALGARKPEGRLIDTGGYAKKDRITHRMPISSMKDIDAEVKKWLKTAYEADVA